MFASYVGCQSDEVDLVLKSDTSIVIPIDQNKELEEIIINARSNRNIINNQLGYKILSKETIRLLPALGEPDVLKAIQNQPGIQSGTEGSTNIHVRGGGSGDNLIVLDDIPLYNVSHLYGFFSSFNSMAIKDAKLLKGSFPARYGGRSSSVIDIRTIDGNTKKLSVNTNIGFISSSTTMDGPIFSDKTTYLISGRRSYFDSYSNIIKSAKLLKNSFPDYYFYDINAKIAHTFSKKNKIYFNYYSSKDDIKNINSSETDFTNNKAINLQQNELSGWNNQIFSLRWNHVFQNTMFNNTTLAYSRYNYFINKSYEEQTQYDDYKLYKVYKTDFKSHIYDLIFKSDFYYYYSDNLNFRFGFGSALHTVNPGRIKLYIDDDWNNEQNDTLFANKVIKFQEPYLYLEANLKFYQRFKLNLGIRQSGTYYNNHLNTNTEPRIHLNFKITDDIVLKSGFTTSYQYFHFLSTSGVNMPSDLWIPSINNINALKANQFNAGISINLFHNLLFTFELYKKQLYNITHYKNGASLLNDTEAWDTKITQGKGNSKGAELALSKNYGKITGNINYTYSIANRQYNELNNGIQFPFKYDRLHDFSVIINIALNKKLDFSLYWIYGTGYPVTLANEKYLPYFMIYSLSSEFGGEIHSFSSVNHIRLPDYHRLDIGIHYKIRKKKFQHIVSFNVFNAYNRKNPVYMYYNQYQYNKLQYVSLLPIIPTLSYSFSF